MRTAAVIMSGALIALSSCGNPDGPEPAASTDEKAAVMSVEDRFARLALDCIHRPFPNKISHVMNSADDLATPQQG